MGCLYTTDLPPFTSEPEQSIESRVFCWNHHIITGCYYISYPNIRTLPETNIAHENPIFPGKYHQNCGFSMAMLVSGSVLLLLVSFLISLPGKESVPYVLSNCGWF